MKASIGKYTKHGDRRRVNIQIDKFDTWSLDHTLAHIILPALLQLKASKMGVPSEFADVGGASYDSQESFEFYQETHDEAFDIACKRWEEIIDKMIWSFQQLVMDDYETQYSHGTAEYDWVPSNTPFIDPHTGKPEDTYRMVDKNPQEHWVDYEGLRMHEERIQEGLELFGKYYRHLWD
jgi:hypothetical protein